MVIIADGGSTKTEWGFLSHGEKRRIKTRGFSPYFMTSDRIQEILEQDLLPQLLNPLQAEEIYYYGTGCTSERNIDIISTALTGTFQRAQLHITCDMTGAARSLCGDEKGIACILGTGSNSCYSNGAVIEKSSPSLGYLLGDEGSGAYLGKKLIRKYMYNNLDQETKKKLEHRFKIQQDVLLEELYKHPLVNRHLASFSVFLSENRGDPVVEEILFEGINDFFLFHINTYSECREVPVHFTGSIAWYYKDVLQELCKRYDLRQGNIVKEPLDGLAAYHLRKAQRPIIPDVG